MNWNIENVRTSNLGSILEFEKKTHRRASDGKERGEFRFFTCSPIQDKYVDEYDFSGEYIVFGTGGNACIHHVDAKFSISQDCIAARIASPHVEPKYLYYFLVANIRLLQSKFRGTGLKHILKKDIMRVPFCYPEDRGLQNQIVSVLETRETLKARALKALELTDSLKRALYVSTFWRDNPDFESWKVQTFTDLVSGGALGMRTGPFGSDLRHSEFVDSGVAVLGIDNVVDNRFKWDQRRFITSLKYELLKRYRVYPRDVLITIMGTTGRSCVVPSDIPFSISTKHLAVITCNTSKCDPLFLSHTILFHPDIRAQLHRANRGAIMDGLNLRIVRSLSLRIPPLELQRKYSERVSKIDGTRDSLERLCHEADELLAVLLNQNLLTHGNH